MKKLASFGASHLLNPPSLPSSIYWPSQKIKIMTVSCLNPSHIMSSPRTTLRSVSRLRLMFEIAGKPGIFSVPESRGELGIILSPRAYMEETEE